MKLRQQIVIPVIIVMTLSTALISFINYKNFQSTVYSMIDSNIDGNLETLVNQVEITNNVEIALLNELDNKNLSLSRALAEIVSIDESFMTYSEMDRLTKIFDVDEVHVTDENGILLWGNIQSFYGFDFAESEQTIPFLDILENPKMQIAQEPQHRGTDNALFQYTGVTRADQKGIVQVGLNADIVNDLKTLMSLQNYIESMHLGDTGYAFVLEDGVIQHHKDVNQIGRDVSAESWYQQIKETQKKQWLTINGEEYYTGSQIVDSQIVLMLLPKDEFYSHMTLARNQSILTGILTTGIMVVIVYIISYKISRPISRISKDLDCIADGNLAKLNGSDRNDEVGNLSRAIAKVVDIVNALLDDVNRMAEAHKTEGDLDYFIDEYKYCGGFKEVAVAVNNMAQSQNEDIYILLDILEQIEQGNFDINLPELPGKKSIINRGVGNITKEMQTIITAINNAVKIAKEGKFSSNKRSTNHKGDWADVIDGVNNMLDEFSKPMFATREALQQMSQGKLDTQMDLDLQGDYKLIKDSFNL